MDSRKILIAILAVVIVAALGYLGYIIANPKPGQEFSEFYILNIEGEAKDYPQQIVLGEAVDIIIGVVNHEYKPTSYRVDITGYGIDNKEMRIDELAHEERFQEMVSFVPQLVGDAPHPDHPVLGGRQGSQARGYGVALEPQDFLVGLLLMQDFHPLLPIDWRSLRF